MFSTVMFVGLMLMSASHFIPQLPEWIGHAVILVGGALVLLDKRRAS